MLLNAGARVDALDGNGLSPLAVALEETAPRDDDALTEVIGLLREVSGRV
jgi:hypothetical protein